jgi:hypothetical protein
MYIAIAEIKTRVIYSPMENAGKDIDEALLYL